MSDPLKKYWVDLHGNFLQSNPGIDARPTAVYFAADVDARLAEVERELTSAEMRSVAHLKMYVEASQQLAAAQAIVSKEAQP